MRKTFFVLIGILTFVLGVSYYFVSPYFVHISAPEVKEITPLYKLEANIERYRSEKVILQDDLIITRHDNYSFYLQGHKKVCLPNNEIYRPFPLGCIIVWDLNFIGEVPKGEAKLIQEMAEKNYGLEKNSFEDGIYGAKVEITAYVNRSTLDVTDIKQISPIRFISAEELNKPLE